MTPTPSVTPTPLPAERIAKADRELFLGDYDTALEKYKEIYTDESTDADTQSAVLLGMGRTYLEEGDCDKALASFSELLQRYSNPGHRASAFYFSGECLVKQNNPAAAAEAYANAIKEKPGALDAFIQEKRADSLLEAGDTINALQAYQDCLTSIGTGDTSQVNLKIARLYIDSLDYTNAIRTLMAIYDANTNEYVRAQTNLLLGRVYLAMGIPEQAYARFNDSVTNYPRAYDSYSALVALVNANVPVDDYNRGLVDYYAGKYGLAADALERSIRGNPQHTGAAHHYKALSLVQLNQPAAAVAEWDALIREHNGDEFFAAAFDEKAYTQWAYLDQFKQAAQTLLDFIKLVPDSPRASSFLFEAGRIYERNNNLQEAAATWERMITEYPSGEMSYRGLFLAGISYYRLAQYDSAQTLFQRALVLAVSADDQAMSLLWIGKTLQARGDAAGANSSWEQAAAKDPTDYYSERAKELLNGQPVFTGPTTYDLGSDVQRERASAEDWMRTTFNLSADISLSGLGSLADQIQLQRGDTYYQLGEYAKARNEFEDLRSNISKDPVLCYLLMNHMIETGFYRQAIFLSRQILDLAGLSDATSLDAPVYFNRIRFGIYFQELVLPAAQEEGLHPLFLYSVIRQESMFEGFAQSAADARGLMQIVPSTGQEIASTMGWPQNYSDSDLYRASINIPFGARYLARQRDYFNGDMYAALAAYNGGPGNALAWRQLSNDDPDLFLEVIRYDETRTYLKNIAEFFHIYSLIYERAP
jgi:soluble lytic murein transglycosylase